MNVSPVSAIVAANFGPEAMPTCARNTVSPKLRSTRFADRGSVHTIPDVRRTLPSPSATSRTPASPSVIRPTPGIGIGIIPASRPIAAPTPIEM